MGYALFASRKIYYTNLINELQQKLDNISQQKQSLTNFNANISDGLVTVEELAGDAANFNNYQQYIAGADEYINKADAEGGAATSIAQVGSLAAEKSTDPAYLASVAEQLNKTVSQQYAQQYAKQLAATENQLDMQQKKIETQLTVAEQELEAVEQAEGKEIQKATPKYSGIA
mgnify:CR=1 FL=1